MKEFFISFAKYNKEANRTIYAILNKLSNDEREQNRGSYYKSLSGVFAHILGGAVFLLGMLKEALAGRPAAKALAALEGIAVPRESLTAAQWQELEKAFEKADDAYIDFVASLTEEDLAVKVKLSWYKGNPPSVPLAFMLQQMIAHGTHHWGQISQILDSIKIDNDYSGLAPAFIPKL